GETKIALLPKIKVELGEGQLVVSKEAADNTTKAYEGLLKSLIRNALIGVSEGYSKTLKLVGTGYRVTAQGKGISLAVGFSHPVEMSAPEGITIAVEGQDTIKVSGHDKQQVGQVAADIRAVKKPEPYKGKGIRYEDEVVRRKPGKAATK
ncbi:MAG: 50S ribosomal protein L6, partial [Pseudomonadales bacterium]|nr:50S ribosomal protein L6 [Pseudomonadales bacterium]